MANFLKKWGPSLFAIGTAVAPVLYEPISKSIAGHPKVAIALASLYAILTHVLPQPQK